MKDRTSILDDVEINKIIEDEVYFFYTMIRKYDDTRKIDIIVASDVYSTIMAHEMCEFQRGVVIKKGKSLNEMNGTVILAPTKEKSTLVILSMYAMTNRSIDEIRGTLIHELTHAHDYYDFIQFFEFNCNEDIFYSELYETFFFWTEFHARKNGYKRYIECTYNDDRNQFELHKLDYVKGIGVNLTLRSSRGFMYDLMQACGRYCAFVEVCSTYKSDFINDILYGNVESSLINVLDELYDLLTQNVEFSSFSKNISKFKLLFDQLNYLNN